MFVDATLSCSPHWLQDPHMLKGENYTILVAYEDHDNRRTQEAVSKGIAMFGYQVQFVFIGDTPTRVQCGWCWQLGHRDGWVECKVPTTQVLCPHCGAAHHTQNHDYECPQEHRVVGKCDCHLPCLLWQTWTQCAQPPLPQMRRSPHPTLCVDLGRGHTGTKEVGVQVQRAPINQYPPLCCTGESWPGQSHSPHNPPCQLYPAPPLHRPKGHLPWASS